MMLTITPVGMLAGAVLFVDGINGITKEASHLRYRDHPTQKEYLQTVQWKLLSSWLLNLNQGLYFIIQLR